MSIEAANIQETLDGLEPAHAQVQNLELEVVHLTRTNQPLKQTKKADSEKDWLWCQRRLDSLEAQVEILRRRTEPSESSNDADFAEENALLRAENRALIREISVLRKKFQVEPSSQIDDFIVSEDAKIALNASPVSRTSITLEALHRAVAELPSCASPMPDYLQSESFVLEEGEKLDEFLFEAAPEYGWTKFKFFFFPARTIPCTYNPQHYLTFAPRGQEISNTRCRIQPRFNHLLDQEHPLFVDVLGRIKYAGSYMLKNIPGVAPDELQLPINGVDLNVIVSLAHRDGQQNRSGFPCKNELYDMYKRGELQVECAGLQCVGFDMELHTKIQALEKARDEAYSSRLLWKDYKRKRSTAGDPYRSSSSSTFNAGKGRPYQRSPSPKRSRYQGSYSRSSGNS